MAIGTGTAILASAGIGAAGNLLNRKKGAGSDGGGSESTSKSGYELWPQELKDAWVKSYLPSVLGESTQSRAQLPMKRAANPADDPFAGKALYDMQQYSDYLRGTRGYGFFEKPVQQQAASPAPAAAAPPASALDSLRMEMQGRGMASGMGGIPTAWKGGGNIAQNLKTPGDFELFAKLYNNQDPGANLADLANGLQLSPMMQMLYGGQ